MCRKRSEVVETNELRQEGLTLADYEEVGRLLAACDLLGDLVAIAVGPDLDGEDGLDPGSED